MDKMLDIIKQIRRRGRAIDNLLFSLDPSLAPTLEYGITKPLTCHTGIQFFDKYKLKKLLGKGGYGAVYEACDDSDCNNAVKIMSGYSDIDKLQELQIIKKLNENPKFDGIKLKYYDKCVSPTNSFIAIVFDKWEGDIQYVDFSINEIKTMLIQIANQIKILHELGYLHNDLFERNILYRKKDGKIEFTISDFGEVIKKPSDHNELKKLSYTLEIKAIGHDFVLNRLGLTNNLNDIFYSNLNLIDYLLLYTFIEKIHSDISLSSQENRKIINKEFYDFLEKTFNYDTTKLRQLNPYK